MSVVHYQFQLRAEFHEEGAWVVATFPDIDVSSRGRTKDEAARNLIEAAQLFIESCLERNALVEVLMLEGQAPSPAPSNDGASD